MNPIDIIHQSNNKTVCQTPSLKYLRILLRNLRSVLRLMSRILRMRIIMRIFWRRQLHMIILRYHQPDPKPVEGIPNNSNAPPADPLHRLSLDIVLDSKLVRRNG